MPALANPGALACAQLDPLVRKHIQIVLLALDAAGMRIDNRQLVRHFDPFVLEALSRERLYGPVGELVLRYLHALSPHHCRALAYARNRLEAELDQ
jgi:hypothetical protein